MSNICQHPLHNCISLNGRPCKELRDGIINIVSKGIPLLRALEIYLVSPEEFAKLKMAASLGDEDLLKFAHDLLVSETNFELTLLEIATKNSNAAAKLLGARFPERWNEKKESDLEKMSIEELQKFIEQNEQKQLLIDITNKGGN